MCVFVDRSAVVAERRQTETITDWPEGSGRVLTPEETECCKGQMVQYKNKRGIGSRPWCTSQMMRVDPATRVHFIRRVTLFTPLMLQLELTSARIQTGLR